MRTYVPKPEEVERRWWLVDAAGLTLGRLCSEVAFRLMGKHKTAYTPFLDVGDHVIVINAEKVHLSGRKWQQKLYRHHSGYPGGLKEIPAEKLLARHPERLIEWGVWGMLPKGRLGRKLFRKLRVYRGDKHPHAAQKPEPLLIEDAARQR